MSHPRKKTIPFPGEPGQTKTLVAEHPGTHGVLVGCGAPQQKQFVSSHAALDWCETNNVTFYYLPPVSTRQN
jgi:hypothetical protein